MCVAVGGDSKGFCQLDDAWYLLVEPDKLLLHGDGYPVFFQKTFPRYVERFHHVLQQCRFRYTAPGTAAESQAHSLVADAVGFYPRAGKQFTGLFAPVCGRVALFSSPLLKAATKKCTSLRLVHFLLAEAVGFEPTSPCGLPDFEFSRRLLIT